MRICCLEQRRSKSKTVPYSTVLFNMKLKWDGDKDGEAWWSKKVSSVS